MVRIRTCAKLLLVAWPLLTAMLLTICSCSKVSWPALEEPEEYFSPLMQSFSKFPFHDIYETPPLPADLMLPGSRLVKLKPMRDWTRKTTKDLNVDNDDDGKCRLCDLLTTILGGREQRRNVSKKRLRPAKLRKLMKHCRKN